jgi:hypothetical protein
MQTPSHLARLKLHPSQDLLLRTTEAHDMPAFSMDLSIGIVRDIACAEDGRLTEAAPDHDHCTLLPQRCSMRSSV